MGKTLAIVQSATTPGKYYTLKRGSDGVYYCSCPAWKFQRLSPCARTCKHLNAYHAQIARMEQFRAALSRVRELSPA